MRLTPFRAFALACAVLTAPAAQARDLIGWGGLLTNDVFATVQDDRWRTGSGVTSFITAPDGATSARATRFGEVLEFRIRGEVITPSNIVQPRFDDRPYVGAWSFGIHSHFSRGSIDYSLGGDLTLTGPQTGLATFQSAIHDVIGVPDASDPVLAAQLPDRAYLSGTAEASRRLDLSDRITLRPFVELQAGVETLARAGGDLHFGRLMRDAKMVRDQTTGFRYQVEQTEDRGLSFVLGADLAYVDSSVYLPASRGVVASQTRGRVRAGMHWQTKLGDRTLGGFYGITWLTEEFEAQPEGQSVGSVRLFLEF